MRRHISVLLVLFVAFSGGLFAQSLAPTISGLSPSRVFAGSPGFTLRVDGTGFAGNSVVLWNGVPLTTTYEDYPTLTAAVPANRLTTVSTAAVRVQNPTPNQSSTTVTFSILTPLSIKTTALTAGTVGGNYSQQLTGDGGTQPYGWSSYSASQTESLPPGLSLDPSTGMISGIPSVAGPYSVQVGLYDRYVNYVTMTFPLIINPRPSVSTTSLPNGQVGVTYLQTLASSGGTAPRTWSVATGQLPPGLSLGSANGRISGTPTTAGTSPFTVRVTDAYFVSATSGQLAITITINPAPLTLVTTALPGGIVGSPYSGTLEATGGVLPYTWTAQTSALPPGLTMSTAGVLSGTPTQAGTSTFTVTVTDSAQSTAPKQFTLTVALPAAPAPSVTVSSSTPGPAQQPTLNVQLSAPYTLPITGVLTLTFTPDAVASADDPAIQFSAGGRTLPFTIPAGQTSAFSTPPALASTGTVAGTISLTLTQLQAGGLSILPSPAPSQTVTVARSVPVITSVQVSKVSPGFSVLIRGYSTPRQMTQATFIFTGTNLQGGSAVILLDTTFGTWYGDSSSTQFGSQFLYTQPFTIQGDINAITSVSVTLQNSSGSSQAVSASF